MGALKPLAYMRYMRILFLIATSRTDYDTQLVIYTRVCATRTRPSPEGWLETRLRNVSPQARGNWNSFPNYRSFRSRGRLSGARCSYRVTLT